MGRAAEGKREDGGCGLFHPGSWTTLLREEPESISWHRFVQNGRGNTQGTAGHQHLPEQLGRREEGLAHGSLLTGFLLPGSSQQPIPGGSHQETGSGQVTTLRSCATRREAEVWGLRNGARV